MGFFKRNKVQAISKQMAERQPLPMGRTEFHRWADRIIASAMVRADVESQKFALANLLLHLGPTEDFKEDAFFIHSLRKFAVNQVADAVRVEIREKRKAELNKVDEHNPAALLKVVPNKDEKVLENKGI